MLWTAGYSLTTGGFLLYFAKELGADSRMIALLLVIPETVGVIGLTSRFWLKRFGSRKQIWLVCSIIARVVSLGIPLLAFACFRPSSFSSLWLLAGLMGVMQIFQVVAYLAYLSWLSDLVDQKQWGKFFATRNIAKVVVLLIVPVAGGFLRDWWRKGASPEVALWAYVVAFVIGTLLMTLSLLPMLKLSDIPIRFIPINPQIKNMKRLHWFKNVSLRWLLVHNWWLAFFNGFTQSVFFLFLFTELKISLGWYYVLMGLMRLVKIPVSWMTGLFSDRGEDKKILMISILLASSAMIFWILATPAQPMWIAGAYLLWGIYAAANISGRNLLLKLSPPSDNSTELALFRQIGGMLAGVSGLLGGFILFEMFQPHQDTFLGKIVTNLYHDTFLSNGMLSSYQLLFAFSLVGRLLSVLWLLPIREQSQPEA